MQDELGVAKTQVEAAIQKLGISPDTCSVHPKGHAAAAGSNSWTLKRGSAAMLISIVTRGEGLVIRVVSPVLVPAPATKAELYEHILELNAAGLGNCAFGVIGDRVVLVSERPARDVSAHEVEQILRHLGTVADAYDDKLVASFGGTRSADHQG